MNFSGHQKVYFAEERKKRYFTTAGYYNSFYDDTGILAGSEGTFILRLKVEKSKELVDGSRSRSGYFQQLLLRSCRASAAEIENGPLPLDRVSLKFAHQGIETYENMGMEIFGTSVKSKNIKFATFGRADSPIYVPIESTLRGLPDMVKLEVLNSLEKTERVTRGGVDPNILNIGKVAERSERDKRFVQEMTAENGKWRIGKSEETFNYSFGREKNIFKITSELKVQETRRA
jgi:hypothetical protein